MRFFWYLDRYKQTLFIRKLRLIEAKKTLVFPDFRKAKEKTISQLSSSKTLQDENQNKLT
jgi:hypothetical protein